MIFACDCTCVHRPASCCLQSMAPASAAHLMCAVTMHSLSQEQRLHETCLTKPIALLQPLHTSSLGGVQLCIFRHLQSFGLAHEATGLTKVLLQRHTGLAECLLIGATHFAARGLGIISAT